LKVEYESPKVGRLAKKLLAAPKGHPRADKFRLRMVQFEAATVLADIVNLPGAHFHQWPRKHGQSKAIFSVNLDHPMRLLFVVHGDEPQLPGGGVDLAKVDAISLFDITDPH